MGQPSSPVCPLHGCVQILAPPFGCATQRCPLTLQSLSARQGVPMAVARVQPPATAASASMMQTERSIDHWVSQSRCLDNDGARSRNRRRRASMRLVPFAILALTLGGCGPPTDPTPNRAPPASADYPAGPYGYGQG